MKPTYSIVICAILSACVAKNELSYVEEKPTNGFNYPYYLFIPENMDINDSVYVIVEPNNTGFVSDNFSRHKIGAKKLITNEETLGVYVSDALNYPLLIPVFPRPETNWEIYTHALDRDAVVQKNNPLERIDLQLLSMVDHAKSVLKDMGAKPHEKIIMTGFSASGTFVNRFTAIHPNKVQVMAAGGLNGMLFLPADSLQGEALNYPIGTNDFQELFNKPFDSLAFRATPQFLFMGKQDDNDAVPYADAYNQDERELVHKVLGKNMQLQRWPGCVKIYRNNRINGLFKTYETIGHWHNDSTRKEILEFVRLHLR